MKTYLSYLVLLLLLTAGDYSRAAITIDSVTSTSSTCQNNGTITIYAHDSIAISYAVTAGPVTRPGQVGNVLSALPPGSYTVQLSDAAGHIVTRTESVAGSYIPPSPTPYVIYPLCKKTANYILIGHADSGTGLAPFDWQLVAPSPIIAGPQASDTFHLNTPGAYTIRCTDACGSIQTRQYTFSNTLASNIAQSSNPPTFILTGCDSVSVNMTAYLSGDSGDVVFPFTYSLSDAYGHVVSYTQSAPVLDSFIPNGSTTFYADLFEVDMRDVIAPITQGDVINILMIDGCADSLTNSISIPYYNIILGPWHTQPAGGCRFLNSSLITTNLPFPGWLLIDDSTHAVIDSGMGGLTLLSGHPGHHYYTFIYFDHCGDTLVQHFYWPDVIIPAPAEEYSIAQNTCLDSTASVTISYAGFSGPVTLTILSGPAMAHSSKPDYVYSLGYTYPKIYAALDFHGPVFISGLAPGHYTYSLADSCGNILTDAFDISPSDVVDFFHSLSYQRGCPGANILQCAMQAPNASPFPLYIQYTISDASIGYNYPGGAQVLSNGVAYIYNVPSGSFTLQMQYSVYSQPGTSYLGSLTDSQICHSIHDTITIAPYQDPVLKPLHTLYCGGTQYIYALVDTTVGVFPYTYSIISGPQTFPSQPDNMFPVSQNGTYTILALDACGNGTTESISIDSLTTTLQVVYSRVDSCFRATVRGHIYRYDVVIYDTVHTAMGCDSLVLIDSVFVGGTGDSLPLIGSVADTFCSDRGGVIYTLHSYASYLWSDGSIAPALHVSRPGRYVLTVTDADGCHLSDAVTVAFIDSVYILSGWIGDTAVCVDEPVSIHLDVSGPSHYYWGAADSPQYGLSRTVMDSGSYTFTIGNQCGSTQYQFYAAGKECMENLYVPNAFTPNGDGVNDLFQVFTSYDVTLLSLRIFDRWGEKVYDGNNQTQGWDGRYRGALQPSGVYTYELSLRWPTGTTADRKGSLTLIR